MKLSIEMGKFEKIIYDNRFHKRCTKEQAVKLLQYAKIKPNQRYLEIGCGNGAAAIYIAEKYHLHVIGIDVDPGQIQHAKKIAKNLPSIRFYVCDAINLPFQDSDFDIVATYGVMHHVSNWINALVEIKRVLKPGGYFIFFNMVYPHWIAHFFERFVRNYEFPTRQAITTFIQQNNFSVVYSSCSKSFLLQKFEAVYYFLQ